MNKLDDQRSCSSRFISPNDPLRNHCKPTYTVFCSARSWTCPSAWRRPRPSLRRPCRPRWWCWSRPWRRRRWWARPPPTLPFDSRSSWRRLGGQADAARVKEEKDKNKVGQISIYFFFSPLLWQMRVRGARLVGWLSRRRLCEQLLAQPE